MLFRDILLVAALLGGATSDPSTSTDLLWPLPNDNTVGADMYSLNSKTFMLSAAGDGASSDILKEAMDRYMKLIFLPPPVPAVGSFVKAPLDKLTITVASSDESLALDTDNSCALHNTHHIATLYT